MVFRDEMLVCDQCGATFFFTVTEQRRLAAELGQQEIEAPHLCPRCRQPEAQEEARDEVWEEPAATLDAHTEQVVVPEPEAETVPEPEYEPEPVGEPDPEPVGVQESEPQALFGEGLLDDIGIKVKLIGSVKWFSLKKGFGFVTKADGEEVFFHRSDVLGRDLRQLRDGIQVEFQIRRTDKGLEAFDVSILPSS